MRSAPSSAGSAPGGASGSPASAAAPAVAGLSAQVSSILAGLPSGATAEFLDLSGPDHVERRGSTQMVAASVIKLPIAIEALRQENAGTLSSSATFTVKPENRVGGTGVLQQQVGRTLSLKELIETTITYSDNVGANMLLTAVGGMTNVNATIQSLGYKGTRVQRTLMDTQAESRGIENVTSAADVADMLARAHQGQLINPAVGQEVLRVLKLRGQRTEPTLDFMGRQLAPRPSLAHINGELAGVRNDAGIVDTGKRTYILDVFIHPTAGDTAAERAIAQASAAIYKLELSA